MSIQDKYDASQSVLRQHNDVIGGPGKPGYVDPEKFIANVKAAGGTTLDGLAVFSWEDILSYLPVTDGIAPKALAVQIGNIFRGKTYGAAAPLAAAVERRPVTGKSAERMTPRELVEVYDPEEPESAVGKRLKDISKGQPFIVFAEGRMIDVETTYKLLSELKAGYPEGRKDIDVGGKTKKVYNLGYLPENYADENPLYPGRALRIDNTCDQTGRSWEGVPLIVRQLIRVALDRGELKIDKIDDAHNAIDMAIAPDAEKKIRQRYRTASVSFDESTPDQRPSLKVLLGSGGGQGGRPFDKGQKVSFR